ncbi:hypothetical protein DM860_007918 [Cuscuta australis]|uniref:Uncharacterized protein n=1 Tax=Cuscuta australis TaxID=267555 RepID=A0A328DWY1_9ASTE|nr:hypothetical protein DM860_007918 [Cuscuta australis]
MVAKHAYDSHTYYYTVAQIAFFLSAKQEHNLTWLQEIHEAQITFTISGKEHRAKATPAMAARRQLPCQDAGRLAPEI